MARTRVMPAVCIILMIAMGQFAAAQQQAGSSHFTGGGSKNQCKKVRFMTFNASMSRDKAGQLNTELQNGNNEQIKNISTIIQIVRPDVLLLNEFDFEPMLANVKLFQDNYLSVPHTPTTGTTTQPIRYPFVYLSPAIQQFNTGYLSGYDLDNNGKIELPGDGFGFGWWPGEYGFVVLSMYPLEGSSARTFQYFRWKDMPNALLPTNPDGTQYYSPEELRVFRLSSKNHIDVTVDIPLTSYRTATNDVSPQWMWNPPAWTKRPTTAKVHLLVSHPTPPVFDGPEDRNGKRNYDEIRFWADYVGCASCPKPSGSNPSYIYDDNYNFGGLPTCEKFVMMGDQNSDPLDGDSVPGAINQMLDCCRTNSAFVPKSAGGAEDGHTSGYNKTDPAAKTTSFGLRVDYVLPSKNLDILNGAVWWPVKADPLSGLLAASDHKPVYLDVNVCGGSGCNRR